MLSKCVLCGKKLKIHQRRPVNKTIRKYLRKNFMLDCSGNEFICGKCSRPVYRAPTEASSSTPNLTPNLQSNTNVGNGNLSADPMSPPSVCLKINCATKSHAYCFICKKPGPKLMVVPQKLRSDVFLKHNILITSQSRCCPVHFDNTFESLKSEDIYNLKTVDHVYLNRTSILNLLNSMRQHAQTNSARRLSFDDAELYSDDDFINLTGLNKEQFHDLLSIIKPFVRNTPCRSSSTTLGLFLLKMKSGLSNKMLSTLFDLTRSSVRRAIVSIRKVLVEEFVPSNLGFSHVSREDVINKHTRVLAQSILSDSRDQAILVLDGTYIYIQKSNNFQFQRRSYSVHKGRPLVKPMVIVTTTGYFLSVLGPYFADAKNNDASILRHIVENNVEQIKSWVKPSDIFVVDRGFRDSIHFLEDLGIKMEMPAFMVRGEKQMSTEDANTSRLVTKVRWVVEAANSRIKRWKYLDHILPTNQVPAVGDFVRIVCAISNKYFQPINATKDVEEDELIASKMLERVSQTNNLKMFVEENHLERRSIRKWSTIEESSLPDFPKLDDTMLRNLTLGTYQLKNSASYIQEYIGGDCQIHIFSENKNLLRVRLQSRHVSSKSYLIWIKYNANEIQAWYCQCRAGARTVGTCSHVTSILWYLGMSSGKNEYGIKDWGQYLQDAANIPEPVDFSDSDESVSEE